MNTVVLYLTIYVLAFQPVQEDETKFVSAKSGLRMRDSPSLSGNRVLTIPYNGEVTVTDRKEGVIYLASTYGEWVKVQYKGSIGWVFGGYLSDFKQTPTSASAVLSKGFIEFYASQVGKEPALCRIDFEGYGYHTGDDGVIRPGTLDEETGEIHFYEYNLDYTYHFEKGVSVKQNEGYEWGGTEYQFSKSFFELKSVFEYAATLYQIKYSEYLDVIDGVSQIPRTEQSLSRLDESIEKSFIVTTDEQGFVSLRIEEMEGCVVSWYFEVKNDFYVFGKNGGC